MNAAAARREASRVPRPLAARSIPLRVYLRRNIQTKPVISSRTTASRFS